MIGIFNYCIYNHQSAKKGNENAAEEEVQIDKEMLQVLQDVKDIFEEPMFLINEHSFFFIKDINC